MSPDSGLCLTVKSALHVIFSQTWRALSFCGGPGGTAYPVFSLGAGLFLHLPVREGGCVLWTEVHPSVACRIGLATYESLDGLRLSPSPYGVSTGTCSGPLSFHRVSTLYQLGSPPASTFDRTLVRDAFPFTSYAECPYLTQRAGCPSSFRGARKFCLTIGYIQSFDFRCSEVHPRLRGVACE